MIKGKKTFLSLLALCIVSVLITLQPVAAETAAIEVPESSYESWISEKLGEMYETISREESDEIKTEEVLLNLVPVNSALFVEAHKEIGAMVFGYIEKEGVLYREYISWENWEPYDLTIAPSMIKTLTFTNKYTYYQMVMWDDQSNISYFYFKVSDGQELINHPDTWAKSEVDEAIAAELIPLELQGNYKENITRADFSKLIVKFIESKAGLAVQDILEAKGLDLKDNPFTDTNLKAVVSAYKLGIVNGKGGGVFDPDGSITRQEAAIMLTKAAAELEYVVEAEPTTYGDNSSIASWALPGVEFVSAYGIMNGTGNHFFSPVGTYTRQQAYMTIWRLHQSLQ